MASTSALPAGQPPAVLNEQVLPILLRRLARAHRPPSSSAKEGASPDTSLLDTLQKTARILATDALRYGRLAKSSIVPLEIALQISSASASARPEPFNLPLPVLLDLTAAYPSHRNAISKLWSHAFSAPSSTWTPVNPSASETQPDLGDIIQTQLIPPLVSKLNLSPSLSDIGIVAGLLLVLARAHEELLAVLLSEADYVLPALRSAYSAPGAQADKATLRVKQTTLLFCAELFGAVQGESVKEGLMRLVAGPMASPELGVASDGGARGFLRTNTLGEDLQYWLGTAKTGGGAVDAEVQMVLEEIRDDEARSDPVSKAHSMGWSSQALLMIRGSPYS